MKPDHSDRVPEPLPAAPAAAAAYLGDRFGTMVRFAEHLADTGVSHGLIGPREVPRLWERHVLNCVGVQELIEPDAHVADVGSGAGLPGLVIAIARPDLHVTLVEPMLRRVTWLENVSDDLGLTNVTVVRSRAEQVTDLEVDVVTSRAVARLDTLSQWSLPLLRSGGRMLALKGSSAQDEVDEARAAIAKLGGAQIEVLTCGGEVVDPPTAIVSVTVEQRIVRPASGRAGARRAKKPGRAGRPGAGAAGRDGRDGTDGANRSQRPERKRK